MGRVENREIQLLTPFFNEEDARQIVAKKAVFQKRTELLSTIPLYIPYWLVTVGLELKSLRKKCIETKWADMIVNGFTSRGLLVSGQLGLTQGSYSGIFLESTLDEDEINKAAVSELMSRTKRTLNPPPTRIREVKLIYYPMALARLRKGGVEEIQTFDYYRGTVDRVMMRYLNLRDKIFQTSDVSMSGVDFESMLKNI